MQKVLQKIQSRVTEVSYVYTFRKMPDGSITFVVDAGERIESEHKSDSFLGLRRKNDDKTKEKINAASIGEIYKDVTPQLLQAFEKPYKAHSDHDFFQDQWGTWLSGFAPIVDSNGKVEAVLGVDVSADHIRKVENKYFKLIFGTSAVAAILIAIVSFFLAQLVANPLKQVVNELGRIRTLDFTSSCNDYNHSIISEVQTMGITLEKMKLGLRAFKRYVPSDLVSLLILSGKEAKIGCEKQEISILFSDIEDFTTLCETLPPENLWKLLEAYFEVVTSTIMKNQGTVDKFIGDATMSFWNAPIENANHAFLSVKTALDIQSELLKMAPLWKKLGWEGLRTRIGVSSGSVYVGNVGYSERLSYTAIGDQVNVASRLEALNNEYFTKVIVSESTAKLVEDRFIFRLLGKTTLKGKTEATKIFEPIGLVTDVTQEYALAILSFNLAVENFLSGNWESAMEYFSKIEPLIHLDQTALNITEKCINEIEDVLRNQRSKAIERAI